MADAVAFDDFAAGGLHEVVWDTCDALVGGLLVASPADAKGRGIALSVVREGAAVDMTGANVYLVWRHAQARRRGCEAFSIVDAAAGRFSVFYPAAMAGVEGNVEAQVMVSWGERALSSRVFGIRVERVIVDGETPAEDGFTLFLDAVKRFERAESLALDAVDAANSAASVAQGVAGDLLAAKAAGEFDGRDGADGRDGLPGKDGAAGPVGPAGPKGDAGEPGPVGPQGPKGDVGAIGPAGPAGAAFTYADFTAEQLEGLRGPKGDKGDAGDAGPAGPVGATGPAGPQGETGPAGPAGADAVRYPRFALVETRLEYDSVVASFYVADDTLEVCDWVVDYNLTLAMITSKGPLSNGKRQYGASIQTSLQGPRFLVSEGFDVDPGVTSDDVFVTDKLYPWKGDVMLAVDTGCLASVAAIATINGSRIGVRLKGLGRLGASDLSAYATTAYVDEKLAEIASLEEVSF